MSYQKYAKTAGSFMIGFSGVWPAVWLSARATLAAKEYGFTKTSRDEGALNGILAVGLLWSPALVLHTAKRLNLGPWSAGVLGYTALYFIFKKPFNREISN
jgi:hypothetical protein